MKIKYSDERFFYLEENDLNRLKKLFGIFKIYDNINEDIYIKDIFCYSKYDTKNVYKVIYFFYNFVL